MVHENRLSNGIQKYKEDAMDALLTYVKFSYVNKFEINVILKNIKLIWQFLNCPIQDYNRIFLQIQNHDQLRKTYEDLSSFYFELRHPLDPNHNKLD